MTPASRVMLPMDVILSASVGLIWIFQSDQRASRLTSAINHHGWTQRMVGFVLVGVALCLLVGLILRSVPMMAIMLGAGCLAYLILGTLLLHPDPDQSQTGTLFLYYIASAHLASMLTLSFPRGVVR